MQIYMDNAATTKMKDAVLEEKGKKHIVSTAFEHHEVLHVLAKLENRYAVFI